VPSTKPSAPGTTTNAPGTTSAPTPTQAAGPAQLQTSDGLRGLLDTMRGHFGDTMGFQLVIYPTYAVLERVSPTNSHVEQDFMYRDGKWSGWGTDTTASSMDVLADLSAFDANAVAATMAGAAQTLGAPPDNSQLYLIISGAEGGGLYLAIHSAAPGTGYMQINADGSTNKVYPP
jgi:serine/threonine-protein kinase